MRARKRPEEALTHYHGVPKFASKDEDTWELETMENIQNQPSPNGEWLEEKHPKKQTYDSNAQCAKKCTRQQAADSEQEKLSSNNKGAK